MLKKGLSYVRKDHTTLSLFYEAKICYDNKK